jgi:hypothetical protein
MSSAMLNNIKAAYIGDAAIVRNGYLVKTYRDATKKRGWASCCRSVVSDTVIGHALTHGHIQGGLPMLDRPLTELGVDVAGYKHGTYLHHPCSYTRPGEGWGYSKDWVPTSSAHNGLFVRLTHRTMHDYFNQELAPHMPGVWSVMNSGDGTPRFDATPIDACRWAWMWLLHGAGLVDPEFVRRSIAGGPLGDGNPNPVEGFQTHLSRNGVAWELDLWGVPDCFMARDGGDPGSTVGAVIGIPELNLAVAYRSQYHCDTFLKDICDACHDIAPMMIGPARGIKKMRRSKATV